jgi:hypothetical protein
MWWRLRAKRIDGILVPITGLFSCSAFLRGLRWLFSVVIRLSPRRFGCGQFLSGAENPAHFKALSHHWRAEAAQS